METQRSKFQKRPRRPETSPRFEWFEISAEKVIQILKSEKFLEALKVAASCTNELGYETRFLVYISKDEKFYISEIEKGSTDRVGGLATEIIYEIDHPSTIPLKVGILFDLHFHPSAIGPIKPSRADIEPFTTRPTKSNFFPAFIAIAQVNENMKEIRILLVWVNIENISPPIEILDKDIENLRIAPNQEIIIQILREIGLKVELIKFTKEGETYKLDEESEKLIRSYNKFFVFIQKEEEEEEED